MLSCMGLGYLLLGGNLTGESVDARVSVNAGPCKHFLCDRVHCIEFLYMFCKCLLCEGVICGSICVQCDSVSPVSLE